MNRKKLYFLDSNIFIYHFNDDPIFGDLSRNILAQVIAGTKVTGVTSVLTLSELLSIPIPDADLERLKHLFLQLPNLVLYPISQDICEKAAEIRRKYGLKLIDSLQLATAYASKVDVFYSNDKQLSQYDEIKVRTLV